MLSCPGFIVELFSHFCDHSGAPEVKPGQWITVKDGAQLTRYWITSKIWDDDGFPERTENRYDKRGGFARGHHILWPSKKIAEMYAHAVSHRDPTQAHAGLMETFPPTELVARSKRWHVITIGADDDDEGVSIQANSSIIAHKAAILFTEGFDDDLEPPNVECTPLDECGDTSGPAVKICVSAERTLHAGGLPW